MTNRLTDSENLKQAVDRLRSGSTRPLSIRQLSRKLGYSSDRALGMVLQGKRAMSTDMLERVRKWAKLTKKEFEFLNLLARCDRNYKMGVVDPELEQDLTRYKTIGKERKIQGADLECLSPWFAFTLLELLKFFPGPVTAEQLRDKLRGAVDTDEITRCLNGMTELGYLLRDGETYSRVLASDEHLSTPIDVPSKLARAIHRAQLKRAEDTLEEQSVLEREFCAKTFIVSAIQIDRMKKRIREMAEELQSEFIQNDADAQARVVQFNLQFYLQSK